MSNTLPRQSAPSKFASVLLGFLLLGLPATLNAADQESPSLNGDDAVGAYVLGPELAPNFTPASDSRDERRIKHFLRFYSSSVSNVLSEEEPAVQGVGRYCVRIDSMGETRSGAKSPGTSGIRLDPGAKYVLSCLVYSVQSFDKFAMSLGLQGQPPLPALDKDSGKSTYRNQAGRWTRIEGIVTAPEDVAGLFLFSVVLLVEVDVVWYMDDLSIRKIL